MNSAPAIAGASLGRRGRAAGVRLAIGMAALVVPVVAGAQHPSLEVPRRASPTLDARLAPGEWSEAAVVMLTDGTELRLQHDGRFLYLALRASSPGFPSVCVLDGDVVHVLHASASLGHGVYRRDGAQWGVQTPFTFGLRTREDSDAARALRDAYLQQHGWLGTTMYQGDRVQKEMQVPLSFFGADRRIALAYMRDSPVARAPSATWPSKLADGCSDTQLVRGFAVAHPRFLPGEWQRLQFAP